MEPLRVDQPVYECSEYDDRRTTPLWQMEKIAWRFSIDQQRKKAGFFTPAQHAQRVREGLEPQEE